MTLQGRRPRIAWRVLRVAIPLLACAALLGVLAAGYATVPALGPALDPGRGAWASAADATLPGSQALRLPGLAQPARLTRTSPLMLRHCRVRPASPSLPVGSRSLLTSPDTADRSR